MGFGVSTYSLEMGFLPGSYAIPDPEHPGLMRAGTRAAAPYGGESVEFWECSATDCHQSDGIALDLFDFGFDTVDLSVFTDLQSVLARVREAGAVTDADATAIRSAIRNAELRCSNGLTLKVLHVADEGMIMRKSGPNRMAVVAARTNGMNDHGSATSVHADQDVYGTPLVQLMNGRAPELFRHDSPDGHNHEAPQMLLNLWIPLQQITQPLMLADSRSVDRQRHQLRYGLGTDLFLERGDDMVINDIWMFLHDDAQRWYFRSEMDHRTAYVFNTLSTPHGAGVLRGEDVAEACARALEAAEEAVTRGDVSGLLDAVSDVQSDVVPGASTPALTDAIATMLGLIERAGSDPGTVCGPASREWLESSRAARTADVRMSLEMRLVVSCQ